MDIPAGHRHKDHMQHGHSEVAARSGIEGLLKDPVCGMGVTVRSWHQLEHQGRAFYFCSAQCKSTFEASSAKYSGANKSATASPPETAAPI